VVILWTSENRGDGDASYFILCTVRANKDSRTWPPDITDLKVCIQNISVYCTHISVWGLQFCIYAKSVLLVATDRSTRWQRTRYLCFSRHCSLDLCLKPSLSVTWKYSEIAVWSICVPMEELCVGNVVTDENYLFWSFCSFITFKIINSEWWAAVYWYKGRLKYAWGKNVV
jgi:hypothetical protein